VRFRSTALFAERRLVMAESRADLLAGRPGQGGAEQGRTVRACCNVGLKTLERVIHEQGLGTVQAIGEALRAGIYCGPCVPELRE